MHRYTNLNALVDPGDQPAEQAAVQVLGERVAGVVGLREKRSKRLQVDCIYIAVSSKALYNITEHSPIHAHIHTPTAASAMQDDSQLVGSS